MKVKWQYHGRKECWVNVSKPLWKCETADHVAYHRLTSSPTTTVLRIFRLIPQYNGILEHFCQFSFTLFETPSLGFAYISAYSSILWDIGILLAVLFDIVWNSIHIRFHKSFKNWCIHIFNTVLYIALLHGKSTSLYVLSTICCTLLQVL